MWIGARPIALTELPMGESFENERTASARSGFFKPPPSAKRIGLGEAPEGAARGARHGKTPVRDGLTNRVAGAASSNRAVRQVRFRGEGKEAQ